MRIDGHKHVYQLSQIELYGNPEDHGYEGNYEVVVDDTCLMSPIVNDPIAKYNYENHERHIYCRHKRFETTLDQLLGKNGFTTKKAKSDLEDILESLPNDLLMISDYDVWNVVLDVLKRLNMQRYKNRIPAILADVGLYQPLFISSKIYGKILNDFFKIEKVYSENRFKLGRKYFPSLRYIAIKLVEKYCNNLPFYIPKVAHQKCLKKLDVDWEIIWDFINKN